MISTRKHIHSNRCRSVQSRMDVRGLVQSRMDVGQSRVSRVDVNNPRELRGEYLDIFSCLEHSLNTIRGQFSPEQLSALLNMSGSEMLENYLVIFHERFHYLQSIFTPYGQLKWGFFRSYTAEVIDSWLSMSEKLNCDKKIPIASYLEEKDLNSIKMASTIHLYDIAMQLVNAMEYGNLTDELSDITHLEKDEVAPKIILFGKEYYLNGIDIIESYAKFEEAVVGLVAEGKHFPETIDPDILPERYYAALAYFISKLGSERIHEFPVVCELSMAVNKFPKYNDTENFKKNHIGWRFVSIVDCLTENDVVDPLDIFSDESFNKYSDCILVKCGYDRLDDVWKSTEDYVKQNDLSIAKEMTEAIAYKRSHPWALSYPMRTPNEFCSEEFDRFFPLFTITKDAVYYNVNNILPSELIFENHFQAIALQICGRMSRWCIYPNMLQCGFSYFGLKDCKYQISGQCDGHIDREAKLPPLKLDDIENICEGCTFEVVLEIMGTSIREICITNVNRKVSIDSISAAIKSLNND